MAKPEERITHEDFLEESKKMESQQEMAAYANMLTVDLLIDVANSNEEIRDLLTKIAGPSPRELQYLRWLEREGM